MLVLLAEPIVGTGRGHRAMTYRNAALVKSFDHVAGGKKPPDGVCFQLPGGNAALFAEGNAQRLGKLGARSEEHTSELQSLMRISYAVFCLKKKNNTKNNTNQMSQYHT